MKYSELMKEADYKSFGVDLQSYHGGITSAIYKVSSTIVANKKVPVKLVDDAIKELKNEKTPEFDKMAKKLEGMKSKISESTITEAMKNKVNISKLKDADAENLLLGIEKHGKEGTDYKLVGATLQYSDKLKKFVGKYVKEKYDFYEEVADTIARNTAGRKEAIIKWLKKHYSNETDVTNMMAKYASKKKWKDIIDAVVSNTKLKENSENTFSNFMDEAKPKFKKGDKVIVDNKDFNKKFEAIINLVMPHKDGISYGVKVGSKERGVWSEDRLKLKENTEGENNMKKTFTEFMNEQEGNGKVDISKIVKDLADTNFKGSNQEQLKGLQLLKGLSTSDDKLANKFMDKLSDAYTSIANDIGVK